MKPVLFLCFVFIEILAEPLCPYKDSWQPTYFPDEDCSKFWICSNGAPYLTDCPAGLHFNPTTNICDWPDSSVCDTNKAPVEPSTTTLQPVPNPPDTDDSPIAIQLCSDDENSNTLYVADGDCGRFWKCYNGVMSLHNCTSGLHFNRVLKVCDWPEYAGCATSTDSTTGVPSTTTSQPSTKAADPSESIPICTDDTSEVAMHVADGSCGQFWKCYQGVLSLHNCPTGLHFNSKKQVCDWPENAGCTTESDESTGSVEDPKPSAPNDSAEGDSAEADSSEEFPDASEDSSAVTQQPVPTEFFGLITIFPDFWPELFSTEKPVEEPVFSNVSSDSEVSTTTSATAAPTTTSTTVAPTTTSTTAAPTTAAPTTAAPTTTTAAPTTVAPTTAAPTTTSTTTVPTTTPTTAAPTSAAPTTLSTTAAATTTSSTAAPTTTSSTAVPTTTSTTTVPTTTSTTAAPTTAAPTTTSTTAAPTTATTTEAPTPCTSTPTPTKQTTGRTTTETTKSTSPGTATTKTGPTTLEPVTSKATTVPPPSITTTTPEPTTATTTVAPTTTPQPPPTITMTPAPRIINPTLPPKGEDSSMEESEEKDIHKICQRTDSIRLLPYPDDCRKFVTCLRRQARVRDCPPNQYFLPSRNSCTSDKSPCV